MRRNPRRLIIQQVSNSTINGDLNQSASQAQNADGAPPLPRWRVEELNPRDLGLHWARSAGGDGEQEAGNDRAASLTPYVRRDLHDKILAGIRPGTFRIITGDSAAGKTRLGYEVLLEAVPRMRLIRPYDRAGLTRLAGASRYSKVVIWLENLEFFVGPGGLTPRTLKALLDRKCIIVATVRIQARDELYRSATQAGPGGSASDVEEILRWPEYVVDFTFTENERKRGEQHAKQDARLADALKTENEGRVTQYLAGAGSAIHEWQTAERTNVHRLGAAFIRAAVDFRRAGYLEPVPRDALVEASCGYLERGEVPGGDLADAELTWATTARNGPEPCLRSPADGWYTAFDALIDHAQRTHQGHTPVSLAVWEGALKLSAADPEAAFQIGSSAHHYWEHDLAIRAYEQAAAGGHLDATYALGRMVWRAGHPDAALESLTSAFRRGHAGAMETLVVVHRQQGRPDEAVGVLREAIEMSMPMAGYFLALEPAAGLSPAQAGDYRRKSITALESRTNQGDAEAAYSLGRLLVHAQRDQEAIGAYRKAVKYGHRNAVFALADLLERVGDFDGAVAAYRQAAQKDSGAALNLGVLLSNAGRVDEAAEAYRQAAALGDLGVYGNLGTLLSHHGRRQEAIEAWREAADAGYPGAAYSLGCHLMTIEEPQEAMRRFETARQGFLREKKFDTQVAYYFYGLACIQLDDKDEAVPALRRARELAGPQHGADSRAADADRLISAIEQHSAKYGSLHRLAVGEYIKWSVPARRPEAPASGP